MTGQLLFDRCRGRKFATELRAIGRAQKVNGTWWHCARCGHWHAGRRLAQSFRRTAARRAVA
jgi:hypothetical protein